MNSSNERRMRMKAKMFGLGLWKLEEILCVKKIESHFSLEYFNFVIFCCIESFNMFIKKFIELWWTQGVILLYSPTVNINNAVLLDVKKNIESIMQPCSGSGLQSHFVQNSEAIWTMVDVKNWPRQGQAPFSLSRSYQNENRAILLVKICSQIEFFCFVSCWVLKQTNEGWNIRDIMST